MKKIILLALLFISMSSFSQADQHTSTYSVQIATYKNLPADLITSAEKFGNVHTSQSGELTRVSVGNFNNRSDAQDLLTKLKQAGYEDAFISQSGLSSSMASTLQHDDSHHHASQEPSSEMDKFRNLSDSEKEQAVFLDGKLHLKQGSRFIPIP